MKKNKKILTKSDGKKIIAYSDGSWCDYSDLIDTSWKIKATATIFHEGYFMLEGNGIVTTKETNWKQKGNWSTNGNAIELSFRGDLFGVSSVEEENKQRILLKGEIVFDGSARFIVGNYFAEIIERFNDYSPINWSHEEGKFTATELSSDS